jgi:DUF971 family protein
MLYLTYEDGFKFRLPAELLRVESPSAEVVDHAGVKKVCRIPTFLLLSLMFETVQIVGGKRNVTVMKIEPVGNYALRYGVSNL